MNSRKTLQIEPDENSEELARVRAEVARALSVQPPDVAVLSAALERVETMLANAKAELVAVVREIQDVPELERRYERGFFPWG